MPYLNFCQMSELLTIESLIFLCLSDKTRGIIRSWGLHKDLWDTINDTEIFRKWKIINYEFQGGRRILECRPVQTIVNMGQENDV